MTRLQNFFSQNPQTTDDTTNIDYDYSLEDEEESDEPSHFTLPLIPIINDNDTNLYTVSEQEPESSTIELSDFSFRKPNLEEINDLASSIAASTVSNDILQQKIEASNSNITTMIDSHIDKKNVIRISPQTQKDSEELSSVSENSTTSRHQNETHVDESNINLDGKATAVESLSSREPNDATEMSKTELPETTSSDLRDTARPDDQFSEEDNYSTTTSEFVINESADSFDETQTENTISNSSSDTIGIHMDDYFDAILLNDSLLIDESSSFKAPSESSDDYDSTTIGAFLQTFIESTSNNSAEERKQNGVDLNEAIAASTANVLLSSSGSTPSSPQNNDYPYEKRIDQDDQQNTNPENSEASDKFVYHLSTAENSPDDVVAKPSTLRFPTQSEDRNLVRFPDDQSASTTMGVITWPRDNGYQSGGLMRFWQDQPLINDFKFVSRGNSRGPSGGLNRVLTYRRNFK